MRGVGLIAGLLLAAWAAGSSRTVAQADDEPAPLNARLTLNGNQVVASFDVTTAFTESFRRRVSNGLRSITLVEVKLLDADGELIGQGLRHCRFRYDVWEEVLAVQVREATRRFERREQVIDRGLRECGQIQSMELADAQVLEASGGYLIEVSVLLNPVDQETLQSAREFLSNPRGSREGRPLSFFGSLARLFSAKPEAGGERFVFRSRPQARPRRGAN
ncbi:MAG: hypothetical protein IT384_07515 [Deltaproteobacteria bacterium]|nr:hypothetical protein [Deltaproteobacteria bacterium]